jgi:glycosyltransferase involved in cell wall biosynthesis
MGVPVFNGEAGLARCLDSLLNQDYPNLEIVISDNGSTDGTAAIAERYRLADSRIRYFRTEQNFGAPWNFNRVFELSSGKYFAWAAHDDQRERTFVSACAARLEVAPAAVLCAGHAAVSIEPSDDILYVTRFDGVDGTSDVVHRYRETLRRLPPTAFYGLYRSSALRKTAMFRPVIATDLAFLQEVMIQGPIIQVPQVLFRYRARKAWNTIHQDTRFFLGIDTKPWWYVPFVMLFLDQWTRLMRAPVSLRVRARLAVVLVLHHARQIAVKAILKGAGALCPDARKEQLGRALYRRWLENPNVVVHHPDLFFQRVCKPELGWWR